MLDPAAAQGEFPFQRFPQSQRQVCHFIKARTLDQPLLHLPGPESGKAPLLKGRLDGLR